MNQSYHYSYYYYYYQKLYFLKLNLCNDLKRQCYRCWCERKVVTWLGSLQWKRDTMKVKNEGTRKGLAVVHMFYILLVQGVEVRVVFSEIRLTIRSFIGVATPSDRPNLLKYPLMKSISVDLACVLMSCNILL